MTLTPLYDPKNGPMRVIGLLSGSGSNIRKLWEHQKKLDDKVYQFVALFSDKATSNAAQIGKEYNIPVVVQDIREFYRAQGKKLSDLSIREEFDDATVEALKKYDAPVAAYGGYMSIASPVLTNAFLGINVHPADLSIEQGGRRVYTGGHAVDDAIDAGEKYICSTTHIITERVDAGPILMISSRLAVDRSISAGANQDKLKEKGDWVVFPKTLEAIARGYFARDDDGRMHYQGVPCPKGIRLETP